MPKFLVLFLFPLLLFSSEMMFIKYDKLTSTLGDRVGNTLGYDVRDLSVEYTGPIKIDKLLKSKSNIVVNASNKLSWPGGADRGGRFFLNGYDSDNEKSNRVLAYYSDVSLSQGTTLKFSLSCGQIKAPDYGRSLNLYAYDNNVNRWIKVGFLIDFYEVYNGSNRGYTMVMFSINSNSERGGDHRFTLANGTIENENDSNGHIPANTLLAFGSGIDSNGNIENFELLPKRFSESCTCLCDMKIKLEDVVGGVNSHLDAPKRGVSEVSLLTFADGWEAKVTHFTKEKRYYSPASSLIDTSEIINRRRFVPEGNDTNFNEDTYALRSLFAIHLENRAEYGIDISTRNDLFKIRLDKSDKCAIRSVSFYTLDKSSLSYKKREMYKDANGWYFESNFESFPFQINNDQNDWNRIVIEVDDKHTICQGLWRVDFSIIPNETKKENKLLDKTPAADWKVDGMKFIVPYMSVDKDYGTFLVITNLSDKKVNLYMDVYGDGGKNEGAAQNYYYIDIKLPDIPKRSTRIYFPKDFTDAIWKKYPNFKAYRYMAKFIATAKDDEIHAAAFQQDGNTGKRSIPVLKESLHQNESGEWVGSRFRE